MEFTPLLYIPLAILGLVFGSFFTMAAHRWPLEDRKEREWVRTPSHCPKCKTPLKWYDNVPVLGWMLLRGRCRACQQPISPRYILMELGTAVLWVVTAWITCTYGMSGVAPEKIRLVHVIFAIVFASLYLLTIVIDAATQIIPDEITLTHFAAAWAFFFLARPDVVSGDWVSNVICMLALPAIFFILCWLGWMGGGDVALAAGFGALFGWPLSAIVALCGFMTGGIVAVPLLIYLVAKRRYEPGKHAVAFGPYLAVSAYICLFFGHPLVAWYLSLFGVKLLPDWSVTSLHGIGL